MKDQPSTETKESSGFHVVVDAADRLTAEEQETLIELLNRRLANRRRAELTRDVQEAEREFDRGALRPATPEDIMKEILS
jgi:polyphosphate kinase